MTNRANPRPALGLGLPAEVSVARCGVSWQKHKAGNNAAIQTAKGATNADCLSIGFFILTPRYWSIKISIGIRAGFDYTCRPQTVGPVSGPLHRHSSRWGRRFRLDSVGINRREVVNERVIQERSSEPS